MDRFTDYELQVLREACSNYTAGLRKASAQVRIVRKVEHEMRRRGLIKPMKQVDIILKRNKIPYVS